jgi:hypothetical protein
MLSAHQESSMPIKSIKPKSLPQEQRGQARKAGTASFFVMTKKASQSA